MNKLNLFLLTTIVFTLGQLASYEQLEACSRSGPVILRQTCLIADYIVRATALEYSVPPHDPNSRTTGVPDSQVIFKIEEVLKGSSLTGSIILNGYLNEKDDYNDLSVPYALVRSGGRKGSCFANAYRQGAQFLLFLKKSDQVKLPDITTKYTVNIDALAPVNEQLHSPDDPWIYYIKGLVEGLKEAGKENKLGK